MRCLVSTCINRLRLALMRIGAWLPRMLVAADERSEESRSRQAVAGLLAPEFEHRVRRLWTHVEGHLGSIGLGRDPVPHLSFHVAATYNPTRCRAAIRQIAANLSPITIRTSGCQVWHGSPRTVYLAVSPTKNLREAQHAIWAAVEPSACESINWYDPDLWEPHITLATAHSESSVRKIVQLLQPEDLQWTFNISTLALIGESTKKRGEAPFRIRFRGRLPAG